MTWDIIIYLILYEFCLNLKKKSFEVIINKNNIINFSQTRSINFKFSWLLYYIYCENVKMGKNPENPASVLLEKEIRQKMALFSV